MKTVKNGLIATVLFILAFGSNALSQNGSSLTEKDKSEVIKKTLELLNENYIFPDRVKKIDNYVTGKLKNGGYSNLTEPSAFLQAVNADLEREGADRHLNISFGPDRVKQIRLEEQNEKNGKTESVSPEWLMRMQFENFRLRKVERLEGNIGYFNFLNFAPLAPSKESITGAMNFIRHSSAVIIDLRENGGGYAETLGFLLSYFLKDSLQIGESRHRKGNTIVKTYVPADPIIKKISDGVPVYILVSNKTSSAAEAFANTLQALKRATIVGEQTKGAANPGQLFVINDLLYVMIPTIEGKNLLSGKSIEGIGVTPDIKINQDKAYTKALLEASALLAKSTPVKQLKQLYEWQIPYLENELKPELLTEKIIAAFVGDYEEGKKISYDNSALYYVNAKGKKTRLDYIGNNTFQNTENKWLRLVIPFADKPVSEFNWVWDDGGTEKVKRIMQ